MTSLKNDLSLPSFEGELNSSLVRAGQIAGNWLQQVPVYLSTKMTGSGEFAQIIEIGVFDSHHNVLFHSQVMPSVTIDDEMQRTHGINISALQDRPKWPEVVEELQSILKNKKIILFNALFESRVLKQSCQAYGLSIDWVDDLVFNCAMTLAANAFGTDNRYGTISIENALLKAKIGGFSHAAGAIAANYALVNLIRNVASYKKDMKDELASSIQMAI